MQRRSTDVKDPYTPGRCTAFKLTVGAAALAAVFNASPVGAHANDLADPSTRFEFARNSRLSVIGLTADQRLVSFKAASPQEALSVGKVSGLKAPDRSLVGIDFRVQDGKLYGLGDGGGVYTIDTYSAQATLASRLTVALNGSNFGIDFNPAANALRIISDTGQNLRHPFAGPLQFQTQTDDPLDYPAPTPPNTAGPTALGVAGTAYTNNDLDTTTGTTQFVLDTTLNQVAIQSIPNNGTLVATGAFGVDPDAPVGFDIYTGLRKGSAARNNGFASLMVNGVSGFDRLDLLTGRAGLIGTFKQKVVDIAVALDQ
jgi:hypothetical protein